MTSTDPQKAQTQGAPATSEGSGVVSMEEDKVNELEMMKQRVKEMEEEAAKLRELQAQVEKEMGLATAGAVTAPHRSGNTDSRSRQDDLEKEEIDARSIYVGNVDFGATPEELQEHFQSCGIINRVTILCDKWTGHPKGYAYIEFSESKAVENALALSDCMFRNRLLVVSPKRTNLPGLARGSRARGRGYRGFYRSRPRFRGRRAYYSPY